MGAGWTVSRGPARAPVGLGTAMPDNSLTIVRKDFSPAKVCATLHEVAARVSALEAETMNRLLLPLWLILGMTLTCPLAAGKRAIPGDGLFTDGKMRTFKITVEGPALAVLEKND